MSAAVFQLNSGFDGSTSKIHKAIGHATSVNIKNKILAIGARQRYIRGYQKMKHVKRRRHNRIILRYKLYDEFKANLNDPGMYKQGIDI